MGRWVVSDVSRARLGDEFDGALGRFTLRSNGAFVAEEVPRDLLHRELGQVVPPISGTGTWTLASSRSETLVKLVFTQIAKERDHIVPHRTELSLASSRQESHYFPRRELYYFQKGDRNQARKVTFERP